MQALVHHWQKCIANGGTSVETLCFVAENLLYQIVLLCSLCLLQFSWKYIGNIPFGKTVWPRQDKRLDTHGLRIGVGKRGKVLLGVWSS